MTGTREYPPLERLIKLSSQIQECGCLKCEQGAEAQVGKLTEEARKYLEELLLRIQELPDDPVLRGREPDDLPAIQLLRESGPRRLWDSPPDERLLSSRMEGALLGRTAGCLLGVPVEGMSIENMREWAAYIGQTFPPVDYWKQAEYPHVKNLYGRRRHEYQRNEMRMAPVDDDLIYTQLALLILEEYGPAFTTENVGDAWKRYLPCACTAEAAALRNLNAGVPAEEAASVQNPYRQWIGAAIRSDGYGWAAAGWPEKAAEMAFYDARLSHRRNGIYGEMFLAAAQSAAFAVDDPLEAVRIGMTEIPAESSLHQDLAWALDSCGRVEGYLDARRLVDDRFRGMNPVHTNNNLCLIVFGLRLAQGNFLRGISQLVAMGMDNDCTAASAGSILGAQVGSEKIPEHLYTRFHNTMDTYLKQVSPFRLDDMAARFCKIVRRVYQIMG